MKLPRARVWLAALALTAALGVLVFFLARQRTPLPSPKEAVPLTWQQARTAPMHKVHVDQKHIPCGKCHGEGNTFDPHPQVSVCKGCHAAEVAHAHVGDARSPTTCLTCHAFRPGAATPCVTCHTKPQGAVAAIAGHATADVACDACHVMHPATRAGAVVLADCTTCHAGVGAKHDGFAVAVRDAGVPIDAEVHPVAAAVTAAREAGAPSPPFVAPREGELASVAAPLAPEHAAPGQVCTTCHAPHATLAQARTVCMKCHVGAGFAATTARTGPPSDRPGPMLAALSVSAPKVRPFGPHVAGHEACDTCHIPHDATRATVKPCLGCHQDHSGALATAGHSCTGCHKPHAFSQAASSCGGCHAGVHALASDRVPAHAVCTSCHDPHRPGASPALACAGCHQGVHPSHPAAAAQFASVKSGTSPAGPPQPGACVGCHSPHPTSPSTVASACSTCHSQAHDDRSFHAPGKVRCEGCHRPHQFNLASLGPQLCGRCHVPMATAVLERPGHRNCQGCHGAPHTPVAKPTCVSCHATEVHTAPPGHAKCTGCHDPHSGSLGVHAACTSCHADKAKAIHGRPVGVLAAAGCRTCHRPHGPMGPASPPACTTCHQRARLPGLHTVRGHAIACLTCHVPHGPPHADRVTCTGKCHTDRRGHQPAAAACNGCHVFRR